MQRLWPTCGDPKANRLTSARLHPALLSKKSQWHFGQSAVEGADRNCNSVSAVLKKHLILFSIFFLKWASHSWQEGDEHLSSAPMSTAAAAKSLQSCPTLCDPRRRQPARLLCPQDSPGKNTGVGCHFLLHL